MIQVLLPQFGMGMTDGTVLTWHKSAGDRVRQGDLLCDIETAKSVVSVEAPAEGIVSDILVTVGSTVPVNTPLAALRADSRDDAEPARPKAEAALAHGVSAQSEQTPREALNRRSAAEGHHIEAEPRARRLAKLHGVDLITLKGSGPGGRILEADVRDFVSSLTPRS
jgi:pyruvate dehydrogenase E2 component (dihydrolipoamide acetyltransferase)